MTDPRSVAADYIRFWTSGDFDALRALLAEGCTFRGPLGTADGADECLEGLKGMARMIASIDVQQVWVDGGDVATWYELHTHDAPPVPTVNWSRVEAGRITRIRALFDPSPLLP